MRTEFNHRRFRSRWAAAGLLVAALCAPATGAEPASRAPPAVVGESDLLRKALEGQGYVSIEIARRKSGYLTAGVEIGATKLQLLVDTGAPVTALDRARTEVLGLRWQPGVEIAAGSERTFDVCSLDALRIGSVTASPLQATHANTFSFNAVFRADGEEPLDGFLGGDVLNSRGAVIDYAGCRLFLQPHGAKPTPAEGEDVRKRLGLEGYVCVDLDRGRIGYLGKAAQVDTVELYFLLDTGAPLTYLDIGRTKAKGLRWRSDDDPAVANRFTPDSCLLDSLRISSIKTSPVSALPHDLTPLNTYMTTIGAANFDGLLGNDVLTKHAAVVDVAGRRLFLQPDEKR